MSTPEPGIPIPQARHPYYCSGCGDYHAPGDCPSQPRATGAIPSARAAEVAALRERIDGLSYTITLLRESVNDLRNDCLPRLARLEAARKRKP